MKQHTLRAAMSAAFPQTIPILTGYLFVGIAFGLYIRSMGYSILLPILMSVFIFAGSMQFVAGSFLSLPFAPMGAFLATLMVNARHLFYGFSMLEKYKSLGKKKLPTIFMLTDETFSINYAASVPEQVDRGWFFFFVSLFDYLYWIAGTALGSIFGDLIPFDTTGIDFVMTALFLVIFMNNWEQEKHHTSSLVGLGISLLALLLFGPDHFVLVSMIGILLFFILFRNRLERWRVL